MRISIEIVLWNFWVKKRTEIDVIDWHGFLVVFYYFIQPVLLVEMWLFLILIYIPVVD